MGAKWLSGAFLFARVNHELVWTGDAVRRGGRYRRRLFRVVRRTESAALVLVSYALRLVNVPLKLLIDSPRPAEPVVRVTEHASGLGFPSGHVFGVTLLAGGICLATRRATTNRIVRLVAWVSAAVLIVITAYGRIYVGAHWPSDTLGGFLWASVILALLDTIWTRLWQKPSKPGSRLSVPEPRQE